MRPLDYELERLEEAARHLRDGAGALLHALDDCHRIAADPRALLKGWVRHAAALADLAEAHYAALDSVIVARAEQLAEAREAAEQHPAD